MSWSLNLIEIPQPSNRRSTKKLEFVVQKRMNSKLRLLWDKSRVSRPMLLRSDNSMDSHEILLERLRKI